jgi:hypothetical protein
MNLTRWWLRIGTGFREQKSPNSKYSSLLIVFWGFSFPFFPLFPVLFFPLFPVLFFPLAFFFSFFSLFSLFFHFFPFFPFFSPFFSIFFPFSSVPPTFLPSFSASNRPSSFLPLCSFFSFFSLIFLGRRYGVELSQKRLHIGAEAVISPNWYHPCQIQK